MGPGMGEGGAVCLPNALGGECVGWVCGVCVCVVWGGGYSYACP